MAIGHKGWDSIPVCERCKRLQAEIEKANNVIEKYARHKHNCFMGEYNTIKTGEGCDCGLSEALKGKQDGKGN